MKDVNAIFCADLHLREDTPACRTDDYQAAMWRKLEFLAALSKQHEAPVLCAGDVFHTWRCSLALVISTILKAPDLHVVAGQHEMPYHNLAEMKRSPLYLLALAGKAQRAALGKDLFGFRAVGADFGVRWPTREQAGEADLLLSHRMVWSGEKPYPSAPDDGNALEVLERTHFRTVVTGDNHKPFVLRHKGRLLVNCGSMMRMDVSQWDYKPCAWLWNARANEVEPAPFPIEEGVVDREHHVAKQDRDARVQDFIARLGEVEVTLDFRENLRRKLDASKTPDRVKDLVWRALE